MLRYLIKTLLQMNLFSDTMRNPSNGTDLFYNMSLPSFNSSLLDWGNFTGFNGKMMAFTSVFSPASLPLSPLVLVFPYVTRVYHQLLVFFFYFNF